MNKHLIIRIDEETRQLFHKTCKANAINPSELLRKFIREYIEKEKAST